MPHGQDILHENDPNAPTEYECLQCGLIVEAKTHPGACQCGGEFQSRRKSLE